MKVLHVVPTYLPATRYGGPIFSVHGLCRGLVEAGVEVHVFTTNVDGPGNSDVPIGEPVDMDGVTVWYFESKWLRRLYYSSGMQSALETQVANFDLVHIHSVFLWPTLAACRAARRAGIPYVLAPRGMLVDTLIREKSFFLKSLWIRWFDRGHVREASALHLTSRVEQLELASVIGHDVATWIIPNGVTAPRVNEWQGSETGKQVTYIGRINWKKGLDSLIRAIAGGAPGHYVVAGNDEENYLDELKQLARSLEVEDRVVFEGPVWGEEKTRLIKNSDLFVMPSLNENFGIAALDAISQGCPTLVTESCGIASEVPEEALVVTDGSVTGLKTAIQEVLESEEQRTRLSELGFAAARQFSWPAVASNMKQHYEVLCS